MIKTDVSLFNPDRVCDSGQIFRMYREEGAPSVFLVYSGNRRLVITREGEDVFFHCDDDEYEGYWKHYLDMDRDYEAFEKNLDKKDSFLMNACKAGKGLRILNQDLFEMIISFIISQQKQIPSIRKCVEALCERFGEKHEITGRETGGNGQIIVGAGRETVKEKGIPGEAGREKRIWYGFPSPQSIASGGEEGLKGLSLGYRERYVYETSCRYIEVEKELKEAVRKKDYKTAKEMLLSMTGIGEKVADCIMLFACGDLDAFPVDTHIISILEREYPGKTTIVEKLTPAQARARAREIFGRYKGFSGLVQQWIFAYEIRPKE
ncbi:MAG: 8-oxoguanine DNA glycosylase [Lachnospiraceae bacterium]|nr:8-oxoguanine DNA glycosylase [Lachnospiraceae bacterium]